MRGIVLAAAVVLVIALGISGAVSQEPPPPIPEGEPIERGETEGAVQDQADPEQNDAGPDDAVAEQDQHKPAEANGGADTRGDEDPSVDGTQYGEEIAQYTYWLMAFTGILAASTLGLWGATIVANYRYTRDTKILQRAYLAVEGLGVDPYGAMERLGRSVAHLSVRNVGRLPASEVKWLIDYAMHPSGRHDKFPIDENKTPFYGNNVVSPGTEMRRSKNCQFRKAETDAFRSGKMTLYVWGEVRYKDGFGKQRFTRFCHRYSRNGIRTIPEGRHKGQAYIISESMRYHLHGNDAD